MFFWTSQYSCRRDPQRQVPDYWYYYTLKWNLGFINVTEFLRGKEICQQLGTWLWVRTLACFHSFGQRRWRKIYHTSRDQPPNLLPYIVLYLIFKLERNQRHSFRLSSPLPRSYRCVGGNAFKCHIANPQCHWHATTWQTCCSQSDSFVPYSVGLGSSGDAQNHLYSALSSKEEAHWWSWPHDKLIVSAQEGSGCQRIELFGWWSSPWYLSLLPSWYAHCRSEQREAGQSSQLSWQLNKGGKEQNFTARFIYFSRVSLEISLAFPSENSPTLVWWAKD